MAWIRTLLVVVLVFLHSPVTAITEQTPVAKIGIARSGWAPFLMVSNDTPTGYLVDYLTLAASSAGVELQWDIVEDRAQLLQKVSLGEHDLFVYGGNPATYAEQYELGQVLFPRYISAFTRTDNKLGTLTEENLSQWRVAAPSAKLLNNRYANLNIVETDSIKASLVAVVTNQADVAFTDHAVGTSAIYSALLPNLTSTEAPAFIQKLYQPMRLLYNKQSASKLKPILEAGISSVSDQQKFELQTRWRMDSGQFERREVFTQQELEWIQQAPTIKIGGSLDLPPFSFVKDGQLVGYSVDYLDLLSEITGLDFAYNVTDSWSEQLDLAQSRDIDMLEMVRKRESIAQFMNFTIPYLTGNATVFYAREGHPRVSSINRVVDQVVAVRKQYLEHEYIEKNHPNIKLRLVESTSEGLNAVLSGDADLFVCEPSTCDSYIYQNFLTNLTVVGQLGIREIELQNRARFAVRNDWPLLNSILDKAIKSISSEQLNVLNNKWLNQLDRERLLVETLSDNEQDWIDRNHRIAFAMPLKLPPFAFVVDGETRGIADDLVKRFEQEYNVDAHYEAYSSWTEIVEALKTGEIDFVPSMNVTEERKKYLLFTRPFLDMNAAIFTKTGKAMYSSLDRASGRKIGLAKGGAWAEEVKRDFPELTIVEYTTLDDALLAVLNEEVDLTIINPYVAQYHMTTLGIRDLVQTGTTNYNHQVAIGVHPSKPELVSLFNKLIASIEPSEIELILAKWNNLHVVEKNDWQTTAAWSASIVFVFVFCVLLFSYLKGKQNLVTIEKYSQRLLNAQRVAKLGSWDVADDNRIVGLSTQAAAILNVAQTKAISRIDYVQLIHPDDRKAYVSALDESLNSGLLNVEYRIVIDGMQKWVKEVSELIFDQNGKFQSASTTIQDISEFKAQQNKLIDSQEELRDLTSKLLHVQEEERKRVARELHDDLSQRLAALSIDLGVLQQGIAKQENKLLIQKAKQDLVGIAEDTHGLSRRLHPSIIDDLGLIEALRSEIDNYQRREEIRVEFFSTMQSLSLPNDAELVIFRVVQEALRNVSKYSEASKVKINLANIDKRIFLQIQDDGMGFDVESAKKSPGLGLKSMMERARLIGAQFHIESEINHGVTIELQIPIDQD